MFVYLFFWALTAECAMEILDKVERAEAARALGGEDDLLAPR
jgi:hypothetical protein